MATTLIEVIEKSIEKNGADKVLTLGHLLNILKLVERKKDEEEEWMDAGMNGYDDEWGDR